MPSLTLYSLVSTLTVHNGFTQRAFKNPKVQATPQTTYLKSILGGAQESVFLISPRDSSMQPKLRATVVRVKMLAGGTQICGGERR